jgi:predicted RNA-binding Zn ribbon-like protein
METAFEKLARKLALDVDDTLLRRSLELTPTERLQRLMELQRFSEAAKKARAGAAARSASTSH